MRHEMAVQLEEHPLRKKIERLMDVYPRFKPNVVDLLIETWDMEDFLLMELDYTWPVNWTQVRRCAFMYCCNSEYQMKRILEWLDCGAPTDVELPPLDKVTMYVAGIKPL